MSISSTPSGAAVSVDGQEKGKTPIAVDLRRKEKSLIKVTLDGYLPFETYLTKKVSGWVLGNLIFGGLPGLIVDALTGGLYLLKPEDVAPVLVKAATAESAGGTSSRAPPMETTVGRAVRPPSTPAPPTLTVVESATLPPSSAPSAPDIIDTRAVRLRSSRVKIVTDPPEAGVFLGGTSLGKATVAGLLVDLPGGESVFRIEKSGYESVEKRFLVDDQVSESEAVVVVIRLLPQKK